MTAVISEGNSKVGKIKNFSLPPIKSCSPEACRTCGKECYAKKFYVMYPSVRKAWDTNLELARSDITTLENDLTKSLTRTNPPLFRLHVGGDFVSKDYANMWNRIARKFKDTRFLAFTKRWDIVEDIDFPGNMNVVYSAWPGTKRPPESRPVAWMDDGTEDRIPPGSHLCIGGHNGVTCDTCQACWNPSIKNVVFIKH